MGEGLMSEVFQQAMQDLEVAAPCTGCGKPTRGALLLSLCPECGAKQLKIDRERTIVELTSALRRSIPKSYGWADFKHTQFVEWISTKANFGEIESARHALADGRSIVLVGESGAGKTNLAVAMVRRFVAEACDRFREDGDDDRLRHAASALVIRSSTLCQARERHGRGEGEAPEVERALRASLLVVDDFGVGRIARDVICDVTHERADHMRPTIYTTHLGSKALEEAFGEDIARRMLSSVIIKLGAKRAAEAK